MLEVKDVCHRFPRLCIRINSEEEASFVPASDPMDGLPDIFLEEHVYKDLPHIFLRLLPLYRRLLLTVCGHRVFC